jgi:hypothetical protein
MQTECSADLFGFARVEGRAVVAAFDGGTITSDAGALLLGAADRTIGLIDRCRLFFWTAARRNWSSMRCRRWFAINKVGLLRGREPSPSLE